nr:reverse transcriptase domain-containing protein [Tanacetum cinerariifolium]
MAEEDEAKTAFYTDRGMYCYIKMPFGLKNAGATYQRLVDSTFRSQIGRNLKAYVDDMVIKRRDEKMLLADVSKTFDNLKKINMKLNPKKCSFGVEEGKFLGYMVTLEGIRVNPRKIKALADLQSPRTLKEMQSLSGKLAALNRFLVKSTERSLPFFNTLKNITKENKHEYRWTQEAEKAFQQMKKLITDLPSLTLPWEKETLYAYLAVTLNEAEKNYAPMEKLALALIHMSRRLMRYFEAHPIKDITDQPIKNILNNTETSGKLAKYAVELGTYNITFIPRNAVKGQVLADFLSESSEGEKEELYFRMPEVTLVKDDTESWTLFTDGASSPKGSSTNNEAEYEALLAGLRIARQMNILNIEVKVDSKLVASHIIENYKTSKDSMIKYLAKEKEFGLPRIILTDNGAQLVNDPFKSWCGRFEIHQMNTAVAHPQANGLVERANRSLMEGIKTRLGREKAEWVDKLLNVLWAHRTSIKQSNGETPFSLTYDSEAVIPAEIGMPTYRTLMIREKYNKEEMRLNLDLLQERRETSVVREARYKTKMEQYYNKKVHPAGFRPGEFVFQRNEASRTEDQGKLRPKWEGPYRVVEAYENGSYKLQTLEDKEVPHTRHAINLRKCYM